MYIVRGKKQVNYNFIPTSLFCDCSLIREFFPPTRYSALHLCIEHCFTKTKFYTLKFMYVCKHKGGEIAQNRLEIIFNQTLAIKSDDTLRAIEERRQNRHFVL